MLIMRFRPDLVDEMDGTAQREDHELIHLRPDKYWVLSLGRRLNNFGSFQAGNPIEISIRVEKRG